MEEDMKINGIEKIFHFIVYEGRKIEKAFIAMLLVFAICFPLVGVNYDLSKYLPQSAPSREALSVMEDEFGYPGMARIMLRDVSLYEARQMRDQIASVEGVDMVTGADTATDVYMAYPFATEADALDDYYRDGNALIDVVFEEGSSEKSTHEALDRIYEIVGEDGYFSGSAVSNKSRQETIVKEVAMAMVIALVIIFSILTVTTTSWFEPVLFIGVMGVAIIINMGSNIIFGTISFFTFATAAILQLAVSMDYSIFLLHTFTAYKQKGMEIHEALEMALRESAGAIVASSMTTIVGFLAMALMKFSVGRDLGFVLAKGIVISLATVMMLMPALIMRFNEKIEKYSHRSFMPSFDSFADKMYRGRKIIIAISLIFIIPVYVAQDMNLFLYGDEALGEGPGTKVYEQSRMIDEEFGRSNMIIAMVPVGSPVSEKLLTEDLEGFEFVNYAKSLAGELPSGVPQDFLPQSLTEKMKTENYSRILISMNTAEESEFAFECSKKIDSKIREYYPEDSHVLGLTPTTMDMKNILNEDYSFVNMISMLGVILVVAISFRSVLVPMLVIIPIEAAILLNMAFPYVMGESVLFIGYIIVGCLQLGATVDYSILVTGNYLGARKEMSPPEAAKASIAKSALSVLTSGSILTVVGYGLFFISTTRGISQVGRFVGRGAMLSIVLVLTLLPALLALFDRQIARQQERSRTRSERLKNRRSAGRGDNDKAGNEEEKQGKSKEEKQGKSKEEKKDRKEKKKRSWKRKSEENEVEVGFDETA